jgi:hypothetical protein
MYAQPVLNSQIAVGVNDVADIYFGKIPDLYVSMLSSSGRKLAGSPIARERCGRSFEMDEKSLFPFSLCFSTRWAGGPAFLPVLRIPPAIAADSPINIEEWSFGSK